MGAAKKEDLTVPARIVGNAFHGITDGEANFMRLNCHAAWHGTWVFAGSKFADIYRYNPDAGRTPEYGIQGTPTRVGNADWPYGLNKVPVVANVLTTPGAYTTGVQADAWRKGARICFTTFMLPDIVHGGETKAQFVALGDEILFEDDRYRVLLVDVDDQAGSCDAYAELWQR